MTIVHIFWSDGGVNSYHFGNKRAAYAFLNALRIQGEEELRNGNIICGGDARMRAGARMQAGRIGASHILVRNVVRSGPP
jgi:hypothetical protein